MRAVVITFHAYATDARLSSGHLTTCGVDTSRPTVTGRPHFLAEGVYPSKPLSILTADVSITDNLQGSLYSLRKIMFSTMDRIPKHGRGMFKQALG